MNSRNTKLTWIALALVIVVATTLTLFSSKLPSLGELFSLSPLVPPPSQPVTSENLDPSRDVAASPTSTLPPTASPSTTASPTIPPPPGWPTDVPWPLPTAKPEPSPTQPASTVPSGVPPANQELLYYIADNHGVPEFQVIGLDKQYQKASEFKITGTSPLGGMNLTGLAPSPDDKYLAIELANPMGGYVEVKIMERSSGRVWCPLKNPATCWGGFWGWISNDQFLFQPFDVPPEGIASLGVISVNITTGQYHPLDLPLSPDGVYSLARNMSPSPDGSQVAYSLTNSENSLLTSAIWTLSIGGTEKQLVHSVSGLITGLSWSPVNNQLIYTYQKNPSQRSSTELWLVNTDESNAKLLAANIPESGELRFQPAWSPDGQHVAFLQMTQPVPSDEANEALTWCNVHVADTTTGQITSLSSFKRQETSHLAWSPDSQSVVFITTSNLEGEMLHSELWITSVDGAQLSRVSTNVKWNNALSWLPALASQE